MVVKPAPGGLRRATVRWPRPTSRCGGAGPLPDAVRPNPAYSTEYAETQDSTRGLARASGADHAGLGEVRLGTGISAGPRIEAIAWLEQEQTASDEGLRQTRQEPDPAGAQGCLLRRPGCRESGFPHSAVDTPEGNWIAQIAATGGTGRRPSQRPGRGKRRCLGRRRPSARPTCMVERWLPAGQPGHPHCYQKPAGAAVKRKRWPETQRTAHLRRASSSDGCSSGLPWRKSARQSWKFFERHSIPAWQMDGAAGLGEQS